MIEKNDDAIADLDEVLRLNPDNAAAYYARGNAEMDSGRQANAIAYYSEAIRLNPDNAAAYYARGNAEMDSGRQADVSSPIMARQSGSTLATPKPTMPGAIRRPLWADMTKPSPIIARQSGSTAGDAKADAKAYYARGNSKAALGLKDQARQDFKAALDLAQKAGDAKLVAAVEQSLRGLDVPEGPESPEGPPQTEGGG